MGYRAREESQKRAWEPCTVRKSCLQREKPIVAAGRQVFLSSRPPGHTRCVSTRRGWAAAHSSAAVFRCNRVAKRYAVSGLGFRRLRAAGTVSKRIDTPYGGFYPLGTPSSALLGYLGATERKRSYLEV